MKTLDVVDQLVFELGDKFTFKIRFLIWPLPLEFAIFYPILGGEDRILGHISGPVVRVLGYRFDLTEPDGLDRLRGTLYDWLLAIVDKPL